MEEDFNLPSPERIALLERLQESIGDVPPHFWAACQICDLDALQILVNCGRDYPNVLIDFTLQTYTMAHYWGPSPPRAQSQFSTPRKATLSPATPSAKRQKTSDSPTMLHRNRKTRDLAAERDGLCCVLTRNGAIDVAHIYPFYSLGSQEANKFGQRHLFWGHLKNFWSKEKILAWEAKVFPKGLCEVGMDSVHNLITQSRDARDMWARGAFALKPISESDDKTTLKVQFFWQTRQQETPAAISLLTKPISTKGLIENTDHSNGVTVGLFRRGEGDKKGFEIRSGDYFTLHTDDPETKPLPSFALLELQWFLQRVMGMAGAADPNLPSLSETGSDISEISDFELPGLELEREGDVSLISSHRLSSPNKPVYGTDLDHSTLDKHQEVEGVREETGEGSQVAR